MPSIHRPYTRLRRRLLAASACLVLLLGTVIARGAQPMFYDDDPISREPESQDASGAVPWDISLLYDLSYNVFVTPGKPGSNTRAQNINTIDEVPDSSWFTNRIGTRALTREEVVTGPLRGAPPDPSAWTLVREKSSGYAPGFTARDAKGETWFISFDPPSNPEGASAAVAVAQRFFWALGYNQTENFLTTVDPAKLTIAADATSRRPSGARTPMTNDDLQEILERSARSANGSYRAVASRLLSGKVLGGFRYEDTRSDDPNDIVPHEHRRELRALRVFGAWTNLTDLKAGNTLDVLVPDGNRSVITHYLQDVGSTFGIGANGPHDWDEGWEYFYQGDTTLRRLWSFGFLLSPWQTAKYPTHPAVGRFDGDHFDPLTWRPHAPTRAYMELRDDDGFWAARRVMSFSDETIRAIVATGEFSDPAAAQLLADVLIKRRDAVGRAYLPKINPIVDPVLRADGHLTFANIAVDTRAASAPTGYRATWYRFDNATSASSPLGESRSATPSLAPPASLPDAPGTFVRIDVAADSVEHPSWAQPVRLYFKRLPTGWKLVGLERMPDAPTRPAGTTSGETPATGTAR
jgi:hypothetical protein